MLCLWLEFSPLQAQKKASMFGGTPSNIALSFLGEMNVEVVTGINLPMLIKLATLRSEKSLEELASFIKDYGRRNISVASELVSGGDR